MIMNPATSPNNITFDAAKRDKLRKAYGEAVTNSHAEFTFEGNEFVTSYARYLLQYLDSKFKRD